MSVVLVVVDRLARWIVFPIRHHVSAEGSKNVLEVPVP
jgi:hypothetical protein